MTDWERARKRGLSPAGVLLVVRMAVQRLDVYSRGRLRFSCPVSTARKGAGCREGSFQTPTGWHDVSDWMGAGCRRGSVFVARRYTGEVIPREQWRQGGEKDLILTRILRLRGLERGVNAGRGVDSFRRFIYLHGTNQEDQLGRTASHGCIRLGNDSMLRVFNYTRGRATWCWIG